jgi:hypothetical protein
MRGTTVAATLTDLRQSLAKSARRTSAALAHSLNAGAVRMRHRKPDGPHPQHHIPPDAEVPRNNGGTRVADGGARFLARGFLDRGLRRCEAVVILSTMETMSEAGISHHVSASEQSSEASRARRLLLRNHRRVHVGR